MLVIKMKRGINFIAKKSSFINNVVWSLFVLVSCPIFGQDFSKKIITEADYEKWGQLENKSLSTEGNWAVFEMRYDNGLDTLFVKNIRKNITHFFPNGSNFNLGGEIAFGCFDVNKNLTIVNLKTNKRNVLTDIVSFDFANKGKLLITKTNKNVLEIRNEKNVILLSVSDVVEFKIDEITNAINYITSFEGKYTLGSIDLKTYLISDKYTATKKLYGLTIADYGKGQFIFEEGNNFTETKVHYYTSSSNKGKIFNPQMIANFPENHGIVTRKSIKISKDGKRIFFGITKQINVKSNDEVSVEVWDTDDPLIYPKTKVDNPEQYSRLAVWFHEENRFLEVTNSELPYVQLNGDKTVALIYSPIAYAPHFKKHGETDYYLYDLMKGTKSLFLKKQPSENYLISFSPNGKYITYFRNHSWWLYDITNQTSFSIEPTKGTQWVSNDLKYGARPHVFGMKGWSNDGTSLFLQDEYDIFQFNIKSKLLKKLTNGRESNIVYALDEVNINNVNTDNYNGWAITSVDTSKNLVIKSRNNENKSQQYLLLTKSNKLIPITKSISKNDEIKRANNDIYVYTEQSYNLSPRLICSNKGIKNVLYQSNNQDSQYTQGKVELITFYNSKGEKLQGVLHYPINYEMGKKYPMILNVYSQMSNTLHNYCLPSLYNDTGFNIKHFNNLGYFVLLPDVYYYEGEAGQSALDCVLSATSKVEETGMIDSNRIGLIGHSFGGFETNYIITKTNKFAAAVSGAGISEIVSWYFGVSKSLHIPELWRSETQQWRMNKSIFEDEERYLKNSPILFADKVNTPLLLWVGKQETNLPYEQSVFFYNALRRAGKKGKLLLYPNDNHVIFNKQNQVDLTLRITNWFETYLKK